jgi:spore coat-associated protein N
VYAVPQGSCTADGVAGKPQLNGDGTVTGWPSAVTGLVGDNTPGFQEGDRELTVGAASEWLCFRVDFPKSAGNDFQDAGVKLDLTFNAEQTANNA